MKGRVIYRQPLPNGLSVEHDYSGAIPLLSSARHSNYRLQCPGRSGLTVAQQRQVDRAAKRALRGAR